MRTNCFIILFSISVFAVSAQVQQQKEPASKDTGTIRLRCSTSVTSNDMLYIVDGVPVNFNEVIQLNPADILSMDLLKDSEQKIFFCRMRSSVMIITTKKANRKLFVVGDAKTNTGIPGASIHVTNAKTQKAVDFITDDFGRLQTDSLLTDEYRITVSATGYESLTISGKEARQLKYRLQLRPKFIELDEVMIVAYNRTQCGWGRLKLPAAKMEEVNGVFRCLAFGVSVSEEKSISNKSVFLYQPKIKVYPNPATANGKLQLSFSDLKPGAYQIRLMNASGQLLYSFQKQIAGKNETQQLPVTNSMPAGIYIVQVMDENKTLLHSNKLIIQ